jgi:hypothetical protein
MCQSKAEGGRRCAFHLQQGVTSGMTTYVASVTGLSPKEANAAYEALEREGVNKPDPTREEVDEFLEKQVFRVRHEPDLTEKRRESIAARLKAAIGRITPNGATFHAWKNLVAESFSRVRRRAATAFLVGALTMSVGACGNTGTADATPDRAEHVAAAPATPGPQYDTTYNDVKPSISQDAVTRYGSAEVNAATDEAVTVSEEFGFNSDFLTAEAPEGKDGLLAAADHMTPDAARDWVKNVNAYANAAPEDRAASSGNVWSLALYDPYTNAAMGGKSVSMTTDGPAAINQRIKSVRTSLDGDGRLVVSVKSSADLRINLDQQPNLFHIDRDMTYYMAKTGDGWKIDGWSGSLSPGTPRPEK